MTIGEPFDRLLEGSRARSSDTIHRRTRHSAETEIVNSVSDDGTAVSADGMYRVTMDDLQSLLAAAN